MQKDSIRVPGMYQDSTWKVPKMLEVYRESAGKKLGEYWEFIIKVSEKNRASMWPVLIKY